MAWSLCATARAHAGTASKDRAEAVVWMAERQKLEVELADALRAYFNDPANAAVLKPVCAAARAQLDTIKAQLPVPAAGRKAAKSPDPVETARAQYDAGIRGMSLWRRLKADPTKAPLEKLETDLHQKLKAECKTEDVADVVELWRMLSFVDNRLDDLVGEYPDPFLGIEGLSVWSEHRDLTADKPTPSPGSFKDELITKRPDGCLARRTTAPTSTLDHMSRTFGLMTGCDISMKAADILAFLDVASGTREDAWAPSAKQDPAAYGLASWRDLGVLAQRRIYNLLAIAALVPDAEHTLLEAALPLVGVPSLDGKRRADYVLGDFTSLVPAGSLVGDVETKVSKILEDFTGRAQNRRLYCTYDPMKVGAKGPILVDRCVNLAKGEPMFSIRAERAFQYYSRHGYEQPSGLPLAGIPDPVPPSVCVLNGTDGAMPCDLKATVVPKGKYVFKGMRYNKPTGKRRYVTHIDTAKRYAHGFMSIRRIEQDLYMLDLRDLKTATRMFGAKSTLETFVTEGLNDHAYLFLLETAKLAQHKAAYPVLTSVPTAEKRYLFDMPYRTGTDLDSYTPIRYSLVRNDQVLIKAACETIQALGFDGYYAGRMEHTEVKFPYFREEMYICGDKVNKLGQETILEWEWDKTEPRDPTNPVFQAARGNEVTFPPSEEYLPVGVNAIVPLLGGTTTLKTPYATPLPKAMIPNHFGPRQ